MGYYSTMTFPLAYETHLSGEEFKKVKKEFLQEIEDEYDRSYAEFYAENLRLGPDGMVRWSWEDTAKFYCDHLLAELIRRTIKPGEEVEIFFTGEDGESWGWRITAEKTQKLVRVQAYIPAEEASEWRVAKTELDPENMSFRIEFIDGETWEGAVEKINRKRVAFIPNWVTRTHFVDAGFAEEDFDRLEHYEDSLAEMVSDLIWNAVR